MTDTPTTRDEARALLDEEGHTHTEPLDLRELVQLHPRLLLAAALVSVLMLPVAFLVAAVGLGVLKASGGAAHDTSIVIMMAALLVTDFWGGGIVAALTRVRAPQVAVAWGAARLVITVLLIAVTNGLVIALVVEWVFSIAAAWAGARTARKQAAMRRQIARDKARAAERAAART